jgi:Ca-activated chloride channel homolog
VHTEAGPCPWQPKHQLAMVGLKTKALDSLELPPANLVFLLDVSGSMNDPRKLPLLKQSFSLLVEQLRPEDSVGIVVYAGASGALLEGAEGNEKQRILDVLDRLQAGGSTNGASGIVLAYQLAEKTFRKGGNNRVILATDGDFNVGVSSDGDLVRLIEEKRKSGIFLTVLGYGMGNYKDGKLEQLANAGNGNYAYIDDILEARKFLVKEFGQNLVTVAKDVKLQVEFNPRHVKEYRLIGYENRLMQAQEFRDDKKDAGELGSAHSVVALYEIVPHTAASMAGEVDDLRYQKEAKDERKHRDELFFVRVRYKAPDADEAKEFAAPMELKKVEAALALTSADFRFAAGIAEFAQVLSKSKWAGTSSLEDARALVKGSLSQAPDEQRSLVPGMIDRAIELGSQARQRSSLE